MYFNYFCIYNRALEVWGSWQVLTKELDDRRKMAREEEKRREGWQLILILLIQFLNEYRTKCSNSNAQKDTERYLS